MRKYEVPNAFAKRVVEEFEERVNRDEPKARPYYGVSVKPKSTYSCIITVQGINEYTDPKFKDVASELGVEVIPLSCQHSTCDCPILKQFSWLNLDTRVWNGKDDWEQAICSTPKFEDCWVYKKLTEQSE